MDTKRISNKWIALFLFAMMGIATTAHGQNESDVLRYSLEYPTYDAETMVMPGIANHTGFGAFQDNPASMALAEKGYLSFSLSNRYVDGSGTYLGNTSDFSDNQTSVGDLGFVYKFPTTQGSLVIGGGYSQSSDFNRALSVNGHNTRSTITDFYNSSFVHDDLYFAAWDAYAIYDPNRNDDIYENTTSVFRANGYDGIYQSVEMTERGQIGEYSAFIAAEVMKDLYLGASIGYSGGTYSYERDFLEADEDNVYTNRSNNTDIEDILSLDNIDATIEAFNAQMGLIYQIEDQLNLGVSYEFPSRMRIEEDFNTVISTTFDNGDFDEYDAPATTTYEIVRPPRLKGGISYTNPQGLTVSAAAEGVFYSEAEYDEPNETNSYETEINNNIRSNFKDVINFRGGLEYKMNEQFTPRIGYAYFPSPTEGLDRSQQFISGGFTARFNPSMSFNLGLQYSFWKDENLLYEYEGASGDDLGEWADEEVTRLNVMAGIKVAL